MRGLTFGAAALAMAALSGTASAALIDGSFETQGAGITNANGYCYFSGAYNPPACGAGAWNGGAGGSTSGLQNETNGAWPGVGSPDGTYYGFIQSGYGAPGALSQTFTVDSAGSYQLSWLAAGRPSNGGNQSYTVTFDDGTTASTVFTGSVTTGQGFTAALASRINLVAGTYTLSFNALDSGGDNAAFIDGVSLAAVPEPATWAMLIVGIGATGGALRRRRSAVLAAA